MKKIIMGIFSFIFASYSFIGYATTSSEVSIATANAECGIMCDSGLEHEGYKCQLFSHNWNEEQECMKPTLNVRSVCIKDCLSKIDPEKK